MELEIRTRNPDATIRHYESAGYRVSKPHKDDDGSWVITIKR